MSNLKRTAIVSIAAIAGSQVISLLTVQAVGNSSQAGDGCAYRWGDIGRAAERLGYQSSVRLWHPEYPVAPAQEPRDVQISGTTSSIPPADQSVDAPTADASLPDSNGTIYDEADRLVQANQATMNAAVPAGDYQYAGGN